MSTTKADIMMLRQITYKDNTSAELEVLCWQTVNSTTQLKSQRWQL